jgi:two-component system cell cycle sensor histidine kinase/response regulator CckA
MSEARQEAHVSAESRLAELNALIEERTQQLKIAEDRFSQAFNANPVAQSLIALDPFEMLEVNPAFTRQFGFTISDLKNQTPESFRQGLDPMRWRALIQRLLAGEVIDEHPYVFERGPGDNRDLRCSARLVDIGGRRCSIWLMRDVTEQHKLERQLQQSQKMEALGQLAAGVAHDFNNVLTVIQAYASLVRSGAAPVAELVYVEDAVQWAAALTRQLLIFCRREISQPQLADLKSAFSSLRAMLSRILPKRIRLEWLSDDGLPQAMADVTSLEQVVMNLVINARDATPENGVITVKLEGVQVAEPFTHPKARAGEFVRISVSDTGAGIPPHVLAQIFEPFFTTKEAGKGTGLGLSTVAGITEQHHGWVEVTSQLNQGTCFAVYIPTLSQAASAPPPTA